MQISNTGLDLIASFEGFVPRKYDDPANNCTIGYGFLIHEGPCDGRADEQEWHAGISEPAARALLRTKAADYAAAVELRAPPNLNQNQFDALTSFCYNIGQAGYAASTVCAAINRGQLHDVRTLLAAYVHGNDGVTYPGLVRRRTAEADLFETPMPKEELTMAEVERLEQEITRLRNDHQNALAMLAFAVADRVRPADLATILRALDTRFVHQPNSQ